MQKINFLALSTIASLVLIGCGSSSSTTSTTNIGTGYYKDSAIAGVDYVCGTQTGKTDKEGKFTFEKGKECKFSLAGVPLRTTSADKLTDGGTILEDNPKVAKFLQSIDADGDLSNGIEITDEVLNALTTALENIDDDTTVLSNETVLTTVVAEVGSQVEGVSGTVRTDSEVQAHLAQTQTEITKELLAGKTFYAAYNENGTNKVEKFIFNSDVTSVHWQQIMGGSESGNDTLTIEGDTLISHDNDGSTRHKIVEVTDEYIKLEKPKDDGSIETDKLYYNLADAKKYLDEASKNGDLAKLLAGKTYYTVTDAHIGSDGKVVAPHVETMAFSSDGSSLHISWIEDGQTHNRDYTYSVTNDTLTINVENGQSLSFHNVQEFNDYIKFNEGGNFYKTEQAAKNALKLEFSDNLISQNPWYVIEEDSDTAYCNGTFTFEDNGQMTVKWNDDGQTESGTGSYSIDNGKFVTTHDGKTETETLTNTSSTALYISKVAVDATTGEHRNTMNKIWFIDRDEAEAYLSNKGVSSCFQ